MVEKALSWREPGSKEIPSNKKKDLKKMVRYMPLLDLRGEITIGRTSDVFKRYQIKKETERYREGLSFTIYSSKRSLDLEASSQDELELFVR